jgi:hypothetical protein
LSLAVEPAVLLIPAARASGLVVSGIAGTKLARMASRGTGERE